MVVRVPVTETRVELQVLSKLAIESSGLYYYLRALTTNNPRVPIVSVRIVIRRTT